MTWRTLIWKLVVVFFLPALIYGLIYAVLLIFGINKIPALIESAVLEVLELAVVVYIFKFYKPEIYRKLNTKVLEIKKVLLLIPISLLARIPTVLIFIFFAAFNLFPFLDKSFDEGVKFQWSDLVSPTGLGQPVDITLAILIAVVITPIVEELVFRGVIFNYFRTKWSVRKSIIVTSILFALVHIYVGLFIGSFILGVFLTWIYYKWGNIKYSMILHAFINLLPFLLGTFSK